MSNPPDLRQYPDTSLLNQSTGVYWSDLLIYIHTEKNRLSYIHRCLNEGYFLAK